MNINWLNLKLQEEYNPQDQTEALVPQGSDGELPLQQIFDMDILPAPALSGQRPGSVAGLVSQPSSPSGTPPTTPTILHQPATPTTSTSHSDLITAAISSPAASTILIGSARFASTSLAASTCATTPTAATPTTATPLHRPCSIC